MQAQILVKNNMMINSLLMIIITTITTTMIIISLHVIMSHAKLVTKFVHSNVMMWY